MSEFLEQYSEIGPLLKALQVKRPFLCCGKSFQKTEVFRYLQQFEPVIFDHIRPNPRVDDMLTAAAVMQQSGCDFMIAAGGGSPMDSAKMIRLLTTNEADKALTEPMQNNKIKALFIPTTAGTGSEATKTSVFYLHETEKFSVHNLDFIPDYVLFDESLLQTVPPYQRRATCLDALCHAIESYWSTKATPESCDYAARAIRLFFEHKDSYLRNEPAGNRGMLMASYYGGKAINLTGTTAPHALCYSITMRCGTAHGHSVAMVLAKMWQEMLKGEYPHAVLTSLAQLMGGSAPADGAAIFNALLAELELSFPRVAAEELERFAAGVNTAKLVTNPVPLDGTAVRELYRKVLCE